MTTVRDLLVALGRLDVRVWKEGEQLRISAPAGALSDEWRQQLALRKAELLAYLGQLEQGLTADWIPTADRSGPMPLSYAQQRLWFLQELDPSSAAYTIASAWRIRGPLNTDALQTALRQLIQRHETLRTAFVAQQGIPSQVVRPAPQLVLSLTDLQHLSGADQNAETAAHVQSLTQSRFDLAHPPLFRLRLLRLAPDEHVLLTALHHIVFDGWSAGVLVRDLGALYASALAGNDSALPVLPVHYVDFAAWQRQRLESGHYAGQLDYWLNVLKGAPTTLELPIDKPRPPAQTYRGATRTFTIPSALISALRQLAREHDATLFMALLSAWAVVLQRYTGQNDLVIGSPIANRHHPQLESLIGCFVNTLALRLDLSGQPSFLDLLARVRRQSLDAYANQDLPFECLVERVQPERSLSVTPVFQTLFVLQNAPVANLNWPGLEIVPYDVDMHTAKFDLNLSCEETGDGLKVLLEYSTDLFEVESMARLEERFQALIGRLIRNPELCIDDVDIACDKDRAALPHPIVTGPGSQVPDSPHRAAMPESFAGFPGFVQDRIDAQAALTPTAVAVRMEGQSLSYRDLAGRAAALAEALCRQGVKPETPVGLYTRRSVDMYVGFLGILKSGGVFLPLDPSYPLERLQFMVRDAGVACIVTDRESLPQAQSFAPTTLVLDAIPSSHAQSERAQLQPSNAAYILYTSGSAGAPKGIVVDHEALALHSVDTIQRYRLTAADHVLQFASLNFDASLQQMAPAWMAGAQLVPRGDGVWTAAEAYRILSAAAVTVAHVPPAFFEPLVKEWARMPPALQGPPLRLMIVGGDVLTPDMVAAWRTTALCRAELLNEYGPTELTITATDYRVPDAEPRGKRLAGIPIGRPLRGRSAYILDALGHPLPPGIWGELCMGGVGVARGYVNQPAKTAERFVPDPWIAGAGGHGRMYRTGDLARYRWDGELEFLGRMDGQVKIRGFRVELGEIESVLMTHPWVRSATVTLWDKPGVGKRLAAYVMPAPDSAGQGGASVFPPDWEPLLRQHLKVRLPDYMMPADFVALSEWPLTPSGKVDRRCLPLPAPASSSPQAPAPASANVDPVEYELEIIWRALLKLEAVGRDANFFDLGGHSLLAAQMSARLQDAFGVDLPVKRVFEAPTMAALACVIKAAMPHPETPRLDAHIPRIDRQQPMPLSFGQQRLWFLDQLEPGQALYNIAVAYRLIGEIKPDALRQAWDALIARHEILRTVFDSSGGEPRQKILPGLSVPLHMADWRQESETEQGGRLQALIRQTAVDPFNLGQGPLLRGHCVRLKDSVHVLIFAVHHSVFDGWSAALFIKELAALYASPDSAAMPANPVQYADYAAWQRSVMNEDWLARETDFWQKQLQGVPSQVTVPADRPYPSARTYAGNAFRFEIEPGLTERLKALSQAQGASLFMTLLSALYVVLWRYTDQRDLVVGTPVANRNREELENLLGFFVNTLVLRARFEAGMDVRAVLRQVRQSVLDALDHKEMPFEKLVEALNPDRVLGRSPLFQVLFVLNNQPQSTLALSGLAIESLPVESPSSPYDLVLAFVENERHGLEGSLMFSTELYEESTIRRFQAHYVQILNAMVDQPATPVEALEILGDEERSRVLSWAHAQGQALDPARPTWVDGGFLALVQRHVAQTPQAQALIGERQSLTYADLWRRAQAVADMLIDHGIQAETPVGVFMDRSPAAGVAFLGILMSGGAYMPLDPSHPADRLVFMIQDVAAPLVLTQGQDEPRIREILAHAGVHAGVCVLEMSGDLAPSVHPHDRMARQERQGRGGARAGAGMDVIHDPLQSAYIIYTSGSTGRPKGVTISRLGLYELALSQSGFLGVEARSRVLQFSALCFDASIWEWSMTLSQGAALCIPGEQDRMPGPDCVRYMNAQGITHASLTPSALAAMPPADLPALHTLVLAGEACPRELAARWATDRRRLINAYGPTETTVCATWGEWNRHDDLVPIGRALPHMRVYVLDARLKPVPVGIEGELCVAGPALARGYWGCPELTAAAFVPSPFATQPGERLYRTGDRVKWRADGQLLFLGRRDHQVKIRGVRVELGEIEDRIVRHPDISSAAVLLQPSAAGDPRLIAYVRLKDPAWARPDLKDYLRQILPEAMVPSRICWVHEFPMTPGGKLDRQALPEPGDTQDSPTFEPPADEVEAAVAELWRQALSVAHVGRRDNFFELGGHSLLAVRLMAEIGQTFKIETPRLQDLFVHPALADFVAAVRLREPSPGYLEKVVTCRRKLQTMSPTEKQARLKGAAR